MNLLIVNTYDKLGGAAIATYRMHKGLILRGVNSKLLVQVKASDDFSVFSEASKWKKIFAFIKPRLDGLLVRLYRNRNGVLFSPAIVADSLIKNLKELSPDIVHLFWVNGGFMKIETLKKVKQPVVWTLHDMWPFTGGCHYDDECGRFQQSCGSCPLLGSKDDNDLSRRTWERKRRSWSGVPIVVVATSHWLAQMARSSTLFSDYRVEVIPNGIDTTIYKPVNKDIARRVFNFSKDKNLLLFSAFSATTDKRKGNQFLIEALKIISKAKEDSNIELVIIGATKPENPPDLGMKVHYMGLFHDEISQVLLYSAADVVIAPSMQENLSNTVMESLACATPVVAFNIGGMPDMIDHQINGYLATPFDSNDLAKGIRWVIENKTRHNTLAQRARQTVLERYNIEQIADQYIALYKSILESPTHIEKI